MRFRGASIFHHLTDLDRNVHINDSVLGDDLLHDVRHGHIDALILDFVLCDLLRLFVHVGHQVFFNVLARVNQSILDARRTVLILSFKFERTTLQNNTSTYPSDKQPQRVAFSNRSRRDNRRISMADYFSRPNRFERFRGVWELISRFEFDFRRCEFFFERFEFLVCSKFNYTQCGRTCACAVVSLYPHNSISNVVASVTIHDDTYVQI